ncbi:hypothetical protein TNCV_45781 [Trichonephila clavipes]|nr:hypothetical protein TNCV_45781 [Trichonephila clavipes]
MVAQQLTQITPPAATPDQLWQRGETVFGLLYRKNTSKVFLNQCRGVWQRADFKKMEVGESFGTGLPAPSEGPPRLNFAQKERSHGKIVEVEVGGVAIYRFFGEFRRAKSYCHLYGAKGLGQRQAYF